MSKNIINVALIVRQNINNETPTHIGNLNYNIGDLIRYPGRCYGHHNFYAHITHITPTNISIEVLQRNDINGTFQFSSLTPPIIKKGLTGRPFCIIN
jgi:hypothetical protein